MSDYVFALILKIIWMIALFNFLFLGSIPFIRPSADVCKKITFFLLSFLENYSKICNNCLS